MTTPPVSIPAANTRGPRARSDVRFPTYGLADCVIAAKMIHEKGGGATTTDHLAAYLGYKGPRNGAYINRVSAAKLFGLIDGPPSRIVITPLAQKILMPVQATDQREGLVEAFMRVPLYKAVYGEYHGKELPPEFGLKNALRTMFGIVPARIDQAYRALISSAETAGFFEVRGSKTQLIMPSLLTALPRRQINDEPEQSESERQSRGDGGDGGTRFPPTRPPSSSEQLKSEYISTLIRLLADSTSGEDRAELMGKIDKLLGLPE